MSEDHHRAVAQAEWDARVDGVATGYRDLARDLADASNRVLAATDPKARLSGVVDTALVRADELAGARNVLFSRLGQGMARRDNDLRESLNRVAGLCRSGDLARGSFDLLGDAVGRAVVSASTMARFLDDMVVQSRARQQTPARRSEKVEAQMLSWLARFLPANEQSRFVAEERGNLGTCDRWRERADHLVHVALGMPRLAWMMRSNSLQSSVRVTILLLQARVALLQAGLMLLVSLAQAFCERDHDVWEEQVDVVRKLARIFLKLSWTGFGRGR